ncbi:MAG: DUF6607 family protein [Cellvibrionaceae bacterium]
MLAPNVKLSFLLSFITLFFLQPLLVNADKHSQCDQLRQFTFSWQFVDRCQMKPRGGTSKGAGLTLDKEEHPGWLAIQESGISDYERDRRAILAMAGGYRTTFDFLEVVGFEKDFAPDPPYQSWGTEYVYVVEDSGDFISLQHIMVMEYIGSDGKTKERMVQKHWRQDWRYEKRNLMVFGGGEERRRKKYSRSEVKGKWAQSVFQVDDSPRYEALGKWTHHHGVSSWVSNETWRPVPRRERSYRKDYDVLVGTNKHTITPTGWIQEEENFKTLLNEKKIAIQFLSKEIGINRYDRVKDFDFSQGDVYWQKTKLFWAGVRDAWKEIERENKKFILKNTVDGTPLFVVFFQKASEIELSDELTENLTGGSTIKLTKNKKQLSPSDIQRMYQQWSLNVLSGYLADVKN